MLTNKKGNDTVWLTNCKTDIDLKLIAQAIKPEAIGFKLCCFVEYCNMNLGNYGKKLDDSVHVILAFNAFLNLLLLLLNWPDSPKELHNEFMISSTYQSEQDISSKTEPKILYEAFP